MLTRDLRRNGCDKETAIAGKNILCSEENRSALVK
jgi:hypothetical protein